MLALLFLLGTDGIDVGGLAEGGGGGTSAGGGGSDIMVAQY